MDCTLQRFSLDMAGMTECAPGTKERTVVLATIPTMEMELSGISMEEQASL